MATAPSYNPDIPYTPGPDSSAEAQVPLMISTKVLDAVRKGDRVYVAGLCPRCGHTLDVPSIPVATWGVRSATVFPACGCGESHARQTGVGCGLEFEMDYR